MSARENFRALRAADPHRLRAAMSAPAALRPALVALFALNAEIARAPWAGQDPLLGRMRLRYWAEQIEAAAGGGATDRHPLLRALAPLLASGRLPAVELLRLIAAREQDASRRGFSQESELMDYLSDTSDSLLICAIGLLGAAPPPPGARAIGIASGLAAWLAAVPELRARGQHPLPDPDPEAIAALARRGLALLGSGRLPGLARPALLTASEARPLLARAAGRPERVARGRLARSEFRIRARQLVCALRGRV